MFDIFINVLEAVGLSVILSTCLGKKRIYIAIQSLLVTLVTTFYNYNNMTYILILNMFTVLAVSSYFLNKKIDLKIISQILLALLINAFCNLSALLVTSISVEISIFHIKESIPIFVQATILSKIFFLSVAFFIYYYNFTINEGEIYTTISLILLDALVIVHSLTDAIIYKSLNETMTKLLSLSFVIFVILLVWLIYCLNKENKMKTLSKQRETQDKMIRNNLLYLENVSSRVNESEHRMNYLLMTIKYLLNKNEINAIYNFIDENLFKINKSSYFINTYNPYFDNLFSTMIRKFKQKDIIPLVECKIQKGVIDNNIDMVSSIIDLLENILRDIKKENQVKITLYTSRNGIVFSIVITNYNDLVDKSVLINELTNSNIHYIVNQIDNYTVELKLVFYEV